MLTKIGLTNFKCFASLDLKCRPLNLLCGINGMGKSTVIQAMLVLRQSIEVGELLRGNLVLGGERADLGTGADVLFEDADDEVVGFSLESDEAAHAWQMRFAYSATLETLTIENLAPQTESTESTPSRYERRDASVASDPSSAFEPSGGWESIPPLGGRLIYVNAERVGPRKTYPHSEVLGRRGDFGSSSEYAWNYLIHRRGGVLDPSDPRCVDAGSRRLPDVVDYWLQDISPGIRMQLERVIAADALIAGFSFERPGDVESRTYRATNVGFGISYVLPVIAALLSPRDTLCMIENPEAHLHPRGQTRLAELAVRAAQAGVQVFVETHSDHFMDGVRIAVRDGLISPGDTAFHYFDRVGNESVVTSPEVDADGRLSTWPTGFFDQHDENLVRLLAPRR